MNKAEVNSQIALYFGFRKSEGKKYEINGKPQWTYPDDFYIPQGGIPNTKIPDFVKMLEDYLSLKKLHDYGGPREIFND